MMKKYLLLSLLLAACLCLTACTEEPTVPTFGISEAEFTENQVVLSEADDGIGAVYGLNKLLELTQWNGVTYAFETGISMADREACIQTTDAVLRRIAAGNPRQINIYTEKSYDATFIKEGAVFTCLQDWKSAEYISALLQSLFGEYSNYGAVYGYASYLRSVLFDQPASVCDADWVFDGDRNILDLNTLCFRIRFFSGKDVKTARRIANTFAAEYIGVKGEQAYQKLLTESGNAKGVAGFVEALSQFYASRNVDYTPSDFLFRLGGKGYDYIVRCKYATMYMEKDWADLNTGLVPMYSEGFLHSDYSEIKQYYTTVSHEMGQYQALFALDSYNNDLHIYYTNHNTGRKGEYVPEQHAIVLPYVNSLSVFYIDALVRNVVMQDDWAYVGTQAYFSYYYDYYGNTEQTYIANMDADYETLRFYRQYREKIGRDIDIFTDYIDLTHFYAYIKGYTNPDKGSSDSFVGYLISRFGEMTVIDILCRTHDFGEYTYDELVSDWNAFLRDRFSQ